MAAPVDVQLRNAQSSILFMQQEHAQTLQGLHTELHKLQKKCGELTFELAMKEGGPDEEHYKKQIKVLEAGIKEYKEEKRKLEEEVGKKERRIAILEQQLKVQERKYLEEIKKQKQTGNQYKTELEKKSEMIAHLTSQIRQFNLGKHKRTVSLEEHSARTNSPQPPREPRPNFRRPHKPIRSPEDGEVRHKNRQAMRVLHESHDGLTLSELREQYSRTRSQGNPNDSTVNFSAFLVQSEPSEGEIGVKAAPPVLPPITPLGSRRGRRSPLNPHNPTAPTVLAKDNTMRLTPRKESSSPEKHTLAVKKVFSNEKKLYQVEDTKSD